jgi:hypothetical protein
MTAGAVLLVGFLTCALVGIAVWQVSLWIAQDARRHWRPPAEIQLRLVEGRFEVQTSGVAYRRAYAFSTTTGQTLHLGCAISPGRRHRGTPNRCLNLIPEDLRGQTVRVGYFDPVLSTGKPSGDHLILKVWRGDRLLLTRPVDDTW